MNDNLTAEKFRELLNSGALTFQHGRGVLKVPPSSPEPPTPEAAPSQRRNVARWPDVVLLVAFLVSVLALLAAAAL